MKTNTRRLDRLTTRQLAESLGVSESSVKRWIDDGVIDADRTAGGHRRIPMAAAVRFIRSRRLRPPKIGAIVSGTAPQLGAIDARAAEAIYTALLADDAVAARAIMTGRYISGAEIAAIGDGLVRPALARLGELWKDDPQGILIEHRAVDTCIQVLSDLLAWVPHPPEGAPVAITASGPDDPYLLPPMLASMTLRERGIGAVNLGPDTPLETIAMASRRYNACLCSVSVGIEYDKKRLAEWLKLADTLEDARTGLVVGGRCVASLPAEFRGRVHTCDSMSELGAYAAGAVHAGAPGRKSGSGSKP